MIKDYNSKRDYLILKEYGRNIQNLTAHLLTIEDREQRTTKAYAVIELMKQVNPAMKESPEYAQKLWDDLYIISEFKLEVDGPYPMPEKKMIGTKPKRVAYPDGKSTLKHYGQNIEFMVQKAAEIEDAEELKAVGIQVARLMRSFYYAWNKELLEVETIVEQVRRLSKGKIKLDVNEIKENNLLDNVIRLDSPNQANGNSYSSHSSHSNHGGGSGGGRRQQRNKRSGNYSNKRRKN